MDDNYLIDIAAFNEWLAKLSIKERMEKSFEQLKDEFLNREDKDNEQTNLN